MPSKAALRGGPAQGCLYLVVVRFGEQEVVAGVALVGIITAVVAEVTMGVAVEWPDHQGQQHTPSSPDVRLAMVHMLDMTDGSRQLWQSTQSRLRAPSSAEVCPCHQRFLGLSL